MPDLVLFDSGQRELKPQGRTNVEHLAAALIDILPCYSDGIAKPASCPQSKHKLELVYIEGHTDSDRYAGSGGLKDNWDLSVVRATNTYRTLIEYQPGLSSLCAPKQGRCDPILSVSGYGPHDESRTAGNRGGAQAAKSAHRPAADHDDARLRGGRARGCQSDQSQMTFLARLAAAPKSLTARMRVGQVEPVALRRAVAALDMREGTEGTSTDPDVAELQQRIASLVSEDALDGLSRRDLRAGCKAILHPPHPPAANEATRNGLLAVVARNKRRAAFFAVIDAYLDGFASEDETILSLAKKLETMAATWPWREADHWPAKIGEFALLDPTRAPQLLARRILDSGSHPRDVFREAGLDTPGRRFGGLAEAAFRFACRLVMGMKGQQAVDGQRTLIAWAADDAGKFAYPAGVARIC